MDHRNYFKAFVPALILSILFLFRFYPMIAGDVYKTVHPDANYLHFPVFSFVSKAFSNGEFPYWLPTHLCGIPLYNMTHFTTLYPFYFFKLNLFATPTDCIVDGQILILFHLFVLMINSYIMMRALSASSDAAVLASALITFGTTPVMLASWLNIIAAYSWMPLGIAGIHLSIENRRPLAGIFLATLGVSMTALASPAQELIFMVYIIATFCGFALVCFIIKKNWLSLKKACRNLAVTAVLIIFISLPAVAMPLFDMKDMIRFTGNDEPVIGNEKLAFKATLTGQVSPEEFSGCLFPIVSSRLTGDPYIGMIPFLLILFALPDAKVNRTVFILLFLSVYGMMSSAGTFFGLAHLNYQLPLLNKIREPDRYLVLTSLSAPALAAIGFDRLAQLKKGLHALLKPLYVVFFVFFACLCMVAWVGAKSFAISVNSVHIWLPVILFAVGMVLQIHASDKNRRWINLTIVVAACYTLLTIPIWAAFPMDQKRVAGVPLFSDPINLRSHEILKDIKSIPDIHKYRIVYKDQEMTPKFWAMNGSFYGLKSFESYFQPLPFRQFNEITGKDHFHNYHKMLGARYYLCNRRYAELPDGYFPIKDFGDYRLYASNQALPDAFVRNRIAAVYHDSGDFFKKIEKNNAFLSGLFFQHQQVENIQTWIGTSFEPVRYTIADQRYSLNHRTFLVKNSEKAVFVLNEYFSPNWKVKVNNQYATAFKVNLNQIGVLIDKGDNLLQWEYQPSLFVWLKGIHIIAFWMFSAFIALLIARPLIIKP